ncbi:MAG TPA: redoxin domain-containing protein [Pyrinomonadaceae bacterium]|nr:redoxin domain-containing protein [Pyrinomonadaceae bacterium]
MNTPDKTALRFWVAALSIFAGLATIQIAFLVYQNRELKQAIALSRSAPEPDGLKPGDQVAAFDAVGGAGGQTRVSYDDAERYLVLITSTKCQWCTKTLPVWKEIAEQAGGKGVRVVGISLDGEGEMEKYKRENGLNFEVVNFPEDPVVQASYKAFATPQTILVGRGGKVERVWQGALNEAAKNEVVKQIS